MALQVRESFYTGDSPSSLPFIDLSSLPPSLFISMPSIPILSIVKKFEEVPAAEDICGICRSSLSSLVFLPSRAAMPFPLLIDQSLALLLLRPHVAPLFLCSVRDPRRNECRTFQSDALGASCR